MESSYQVAKKAFFEEFGKRLGTLVVGALLVAFYSLLPTARRLIDQIVHWQQSPPPRDFGSLFVAFIGTLVSLITTVIVLHRLLNLRRDVYEAKISALQSLSEQARSKSLVGAMSLSSLRSPDISHAGFLWQAIGKIGPLKEFIILKMNVLCPKCRSILAINKTTHMVHTYCLQPGRHFEIDLIPERVNLIRSEVEILMKNEFRRNESAFRPISEPER